MKATAFVSWDWRRTFKGRPESLPKPEGEPLKIHVRGHTPWSEIFGNMVGENRQRSIPGLVLMVAQAFFQRHILLV